MSAVSTLAVERKVYSCTAPVLKLLSFERTKALPLPGLTCWNSTIRHKSLLYSIVNPFLNSLTEIIVIVKLPHFYTYLYYQSYLLFRNINSIITQNYKIKSSSFGNCDITYG